MAKDGWMPIANKMVIRKATSRIINVYEDKSTFGLVWILSVGVNKAQKMERISLIFILATGIY